MDATGRRLTNVVGWASAHVTPPRSRADRGLKPTYMTRSTSHPMAHGRIMKPLAVLTVTLVAVGIGGAICLSHANRRSALAAAAKWARLAPLPTSARDVGVDAKGSAFTREFVVTFDAPAAEIERWIAASPGPASATRTTAGSVTTYAITPGGGAQFAEVKVDRVANRVVIRTYWS